MNTEISKEQAVAEMVLDPVGIIKALREEMNAEIMQLRGEMLTMQGELIMLRTDSEDNLQRMKRNISCAMHTDYDVTFPYGNMPQS